ncbi:hypothetical protein LTR37_004955 [Vermiconidia calcicola]|uniref:Uncharacterized protein n=1 Tax=Vermiconidia calcicola TaxID=1690605 RepID=A0ACC3NLF4_9PEZI|nr:hypothetical protein LTR37_004955 [Vermiconidia calcicola]
MAIMGLFSGLSLARPTQQPAECAACLEPQDTWTQDQSDHCPALLDSGACTSTSLARSAEPPAECAACLQPASTWTQDQSDHCPALLDSGACEGVLLLFSQSKTSMADLLLTATKHQPRAESWASTSYVTTRVTVTKHQPRGESYSSTVYVTTTPDYCTARPPTTTYVPPPMMTTPVQPSSPPATTTSCRTAQIWRSSEYIPSKACHTMTRSSSEAHVIPSHKTSHLLATSTPVSASSASASGSVPSYKTFHSMTTSASMPAPPSGLTSAPSGPHYSVSIPKKYATSTISSGSIGTSESSESAIPTLPTLLGGGSQVEGSVVGLLAVAGVAVFPFL